MIKKTKIVKMYLGDLDFIINSKRKALEKAFGTKIDDVLDYITKKDGLKYSDTIYISETTIDGTWGPLMGIQALVNSGYKAIYKTNHKFNFWIKPV